MCVERCLSRGQSGGRSDDNIETLKKRLKTYHESTMPILEQFKIQKILHKIDATPGPDEVGCQSIYYILIDQRSIILSSSRCSRPCRRHLVKLVWILHKSRTEIAPENARQDCLYFLLIFFSQSISFPAQLCFLWFVLFISN